MTVGEFELNWTFVLTERAVRGRGEGRGPTLSRPPGPLTLPGREKWAGGCLFVLELNPSNRESSSPGIVGDLSLLCPSLNNFSSGHQERNISV